MLQRLSYYCPLRPIFFGRAIAAVDSLLLLTDELTAARCSKVLACSRLRHTHYSVRIMSYRDIITIEPDKRGGKPCIRRMRITVYDVLGWLAAGMSIAEIIDDFPELTEADIRACLAFAADREHRLVALVSAAQAEVQYPNSLLPYFR